jgi:hypothetical protein
VVDFSKLIGAESDYTHKREIVPDGMFYKCENLQKKIGAREAFVSRVQKELYSTDFGLFCRFYFTLSQFGNVITS